MDFPALTQKFCDAACTGGKELAPLFTQDGTYHDGFYGAFTGRDAIEDMIDHYFQRDGEDFQWVMYEPVFAGGIGYARYIFGYTSRIAGCEGRRVVFEGISQFRIERGLIANYTEVFDAGIGTAQLGFGAERIAKRARNNAERLRSQPDASAFLEGAPAKISD